MRVRGAILHECGQFVFSRWSSVRLDSVISHLQTQRDKTYCYWYTQELLRGDAIEQQEGPHIKKKDAKETDSYTLNDGRPFGPPPQKSIHAPGIFYLVFPEDISLLRFVFFDETLSGCFSIVHAL